MVVVAKYILKKSVQLNELETKKEKLVKEITHWLQLSGVPYADIPPYNEAVIKMANGEYESEAEIEKALLKLIESNGLE